MKTLRYIVMPLIAVAICCNSGVNDDKSTIVNEASELAITNYSKTIPLEKIKLPKDFIIEVFAEVNDPRQMTVSPSGIVYVGNRNGDKVYALQDTNGDHKADKRWIVASDLNMPNGVAFKDGDLYIAEVNRITKLVNIEASLANPPKPVVVNDSYPRDTHHGWKYIAFGPEQKLYISVGAPCNICESKNPIYASITRINIDGSEREIFASGIRNSVGFAWHPVTKELWFTDNGRDMLGDNIPSCELNTAPKAGIHFGYPYCHEGSIKDPEFGSKHACKEFAPPVYKLGPHVAPLGLKFYTGNMFPTAYKNNLLIALHGSWNRTKKIGYEIMLIELEDNKPVSHKTFASGWLNDESQKSWGRPVDVVQLKDGAILVSDDQANVIYRISYKKGA